MQLIDKISNSRLAIPLRIAEIILICLTWAWVFLFLYFVFLIRSELGTYPAATNYYPADLETATRFRNTILNLNIANCLLVPAGLAISAFRLFEAYRHSDNRSKMVLNLGLVCLYLVGFGASYALNLTQTMNWLWE